MKCRQPFIALFSLVLFCSIPFARTDNVAAENGRENSIYWYLYGSLGNTGNLLRKIQTKESISFRISCISSGLQKTCQASELNRRIHSSLQYHKRLKFIYRNEDPLLTILFADDEIARFKKRQLDVKYAAEFRDSDDDDCQLYYSVKNHLIENIVLIVSLDATSFKQRVCIANQVQQGLGLALARRLPFSKLWALGPSDPENISSLSEENLKALVRSYGALSYLHMCADLKPGMNAAAIVKTLRGESCWHGLTMSSERLR